jgi:hypothetical protein
MKLSLTSAELNTRINTTDNKIDVVDTVVDNIQARTSNLLYKSISFSATDGTIDLATATGGDIYIEDVLVYSLVAATDLVSISIQTNDTTPFVVMTSVEGAAANLTAQKTVKTANSQNSFYLMSGNKLQYTIDTAGNWSGYIVIKYKVIGSGSLV